MIKSIAIKQYLRICAVILSCSILSCKLYSQLKPNTPSWNALTDDQKKNYADSISKIKAIQFLSNNLGDEFFKENLTFYEVYDKCVLFNINNSKCNSGRKLIDVIIPQWWTNDDCKITFTKKQIINCLNNCDSCNFMIDFDKAFEIAKLSEIQIDKHKYRYSLTFFEGNFNKPMWSFETIDNLSMGQTITIDAKTCEYKIGFWKSEH